MRAFVIFLVFFAAVPVAVAQQALVGVNLAGADFGDEALPGVFGKDYTYPTAQEMAYFRAKGMNVFRLPFRWERLQHSPLAPLDEAELARIRAFVEEATGQGAYVVLDVHNYARFRGAVVGAKGSPVPAGALADFWGRLAAQFAGNDKVILGLMNEPYDMPTELWRDVANQAIARIRSVGAPNLILVPGNGWSGAHSWFSHDYGTPNSVAMAQISDPANNIAYDLHQYLDGDSSGTDANCAGKTIGSERLEEVTGWLRKAHAMGFLSEFAGGANETCTAALRDMLGFMGQNRDVWLGWTWWAAGPWWGDYMFSLEPEAGRDKPQMRVLRPFLGPLRQ